VKKLGMLQPQQELGTYREALRICSNPAKQRSLALGQPGTAQVSEVSGRTAHRAARLHFSSRSLRAYSAQR